MAETSAMRPEVFVAMSFDVRLQPVYQKVVRPVLEDHGFRCVRADEVHTSGVIMDQVREHMRSASLVLCDLTFENPNVFYELGVAHVLDKPTILISQNPANIPFDVRHLRVIGYEDSKLGLLDLREMLVETLQRTCPLGEKGVAVLATRIFQPVISEELEVQRTALFSNNLEFVRYAVKFLGDSLDRVSYNRIESIALTAWNSDLLRDAFAALYKIDPERARPILLNNGLLAQAEYVVRERVVQQIGNYNPTDELVNRMIQQMTDSSWGVRRTVCQILGKWGNPKAAAALQNALSDSQPEVRLEAAEALRRLAEGQGQSHDSASYSRYETIALTSQNTTELIEALTFISRTNPAKAVPVLLEQGLLYQNDYLVRERVVRLLADHPPTDALVDRLIDQSTDSSWGVRREVCRTLGVWRHERGISRLRQLMQDEQEEVRVEAGNLLNAVLPTTKPRKSIVLPLPA